MLEVKQTIGDPARTQARVLRLIRELLSELSSERGLRAVNLEASLARDLGIGSLERLELLLRLEKEFSIQLADRVMTEAETPLEIVNALLRHDFSQTEVLSSGPSHSLREPASTSFDLASISTLNESLWRYAKLEPERLHIHLREPDGQMRAIRYGQLFDQAMAVAAGLIENGLEQGQAVAIMLPT